MTPDWERTYHPNQTSARLMANYAELRFGETGAPEDPRMLLAWDLFIKARSYAWLNKLAFGVSVVLGLLVVLWPALSAVVTDVEGAPALVKTILTSPIVQTTMTALAAAAFAFYSHYKGRQLHAENLMRVVVLAEEANEEMIAAVVRDMQRLDVGFAFADALLRRNEPAGGVREEDVRDDEEGEERGGGGDERPGGDGRPVVAGGSGGGAGPAPSTADDEPGDEPRQPGARAGDEPTP